MNFFSLLFLASLAALGLFVLYLLYAAVIFFFSKSLILGVLFLFFGLPVLARFLFIAFFGLFPSLLSLFSQPRKHSNRSPQDAAQKDDDEVIDVKYKIIK